MQAFARIGFLEGFLEAKKGTQQVHFLLDPPLKPCADLCVRNTSLRSAQILELIIKEPLVSYLERIKMSNDEQQLFAWG